MEKHGHCKRGRESKEYGSWMRMKTRCKSNQKNFKKYYKSRDIKVCDRWLESFQNFLDDMGLAPSIKHSLDRIENSKGYYPENCRWATSKEQMNNTTWNRILEYKNEKFTMAHASEKFGIPYKALEQRLRHGWDVERALEQSVKKKPRKAITQSLRG